MTIRQIKSHDISKRQVWEAYKKVKENKGSGCVRQLGIPTIADRVAQYDL